MKFSWEIIDEVAEPHCNILYQTERARMIGGWLIRSRSLFGIDEDDDIMWKRSSESMVFISDPHHEWTIN